MASTQTSSSFDLPRCIHHTAPDTSGLVCGADPHHVKTARRWAMQATRTTPSAAHPLLVSLTELHANALRHTASGLPGGRVRIENERRRSLFLLRISDDGPNPGGKVTVPLPPRKLDPKVRALSLAEGGYGLPLMDTMALYWDFAGNEREL